MYGYCADTVYVGMTEVLRPSLYGAQHPISILKDTEEVSSYIIVGHCCESGDLFSCAPGDPEGDSYLSYGSAG